MPAMFVPYYGPSNKNNPKTRRAVNAFKAARGASRSHGRRNPARGTFQWMHIPESSSAESTDTEDSSTDPETVKSSPESQTLFVEAAISAPLTRYAIGGEKLYSVRGHQAKGPLTAAALSHYFDILLPHDLNALGLGDPGKGTFGAGLLHWTAHSDGVLHGLAAFALCSLETIGKTDAIYRAILHHRRKLLAYVHRRLERREVDDVLIQAICLLIPVDDYLGYVEYGPVHQKGLSDIVEIRGGFERVGNSDVVSFGANLQRSMLTVMSMIEFHMRTRITPESVHLGRSMPTASLLPETRQKLSSLPPGLAELFHAGILSANVVPILMSYQTWLIQVEDIEPRSRNAWRSPVPPGLSNVENCLVVTLVCLADDTSAMGTHPAAAIFRKPKQRCDALTDVPELWTDPVLVDCVIWMTTVTSTPRNNQIIDGDIQKALLKKSIRGRVFALEWEEIQRRLRRFYYSELRAGEWEKTWGVVLDEI
ncbi:hypothetical protein BJY01DRAFT_226224 [Aspergillus pseudoustus]|uniref:Fungal-specific transcription factor domain-containing protein n=1 Tax=Aspergillus pseudoustus TaxID=1810923 RepID=A0ABR4IWC3_9EURO